MKSFSISAALAVILLGTQEAFAFPTLLNEMYARAAAKSEIQGRSAPPQGSPDPEAAILGFNPALQYVSNQGNHQFIAPGPTDQRGPCPGLNAMANHNYLPRNGIATIDQFVTGTLQVFGMGADLATFLGIYGAVVDGDLTKYSIGGPDPRVTTLLGYPQGLSGSHNKYEGDNSPTRGDLYLYGNDYKLQLNYFTELFRRGMADDNYDISLLTQYRADRFSEAIANNPYFFNAPFSGVIAQPAAWAFVYRFMANKSAEYPQGQLNAVSLKSFFGITGDYPNFVYHEGQERIPDNWYTRARGDEYDIPFLSIDSNVMTVEHPEFASVGGNTGTTNSFVGVDAALLTGGVFNSATLLQGNNLFCYGMQVAVQMLPDFLSGLFTDINSAEDALGTEINKVTNSLGCPKLNKIDKSQFSKYPGYTKLKSNGNY